MEKVMDYRITITPLDRSGRGFPFAEMTVFMSRDELKHKRVGPSFRQIIRECGDAAEWISAVAEDFAATQNAE